MNLLKCILIFVIFFNVLKGDVEKYFPALNPTELTPAFSKDKVAITTSGEMREFLEQLAKNNKNVDFYSLGKSKQGRDIPYVLISEKGYDPEKLTIWIQAMQHGNEHGSGEAALNIASFLSKNRDNILKEINAIIVPRANMDGAESNERLNNGIDMNQDHMKMDLPASIAIKNGFLKYLPELVIDLHEYPAEEENFADLPGKKILPYFDILKYKSVNKNIPQTITEISDDFLEIISEELLKKGLTSNIYYNNLKKTENNEIILKLPTAASGALRNAYGILSSVSILIEGRGRGENLVGYSRRVESIAEAGKVIIENAAKGKKRFKSTVANGRKEISESKNTEIIVWAGDVSRPGTFMFLDVEKGTPENFNVNFVNNTSETNQIKRNYPLGYLVNADESKIIKNLDAHQISYIVLDEDKKMKVENYKKIGKKYKTTEEIQIQKKGDIFVSVEQFQGHIIALLFEPEGLESFVSNKRVNSSKETLPYKRVIEF
ncbi:MAG: M14 family zinc carboxypeptidase [Fusobacteriaceae bacterium]